MAEKEKKLLEEDLYKPVKEYLVELGYDVKGEVRNCDVSAVKGDTFLVVEMKTTLNLDVILQAVLRQRIADIVYIAVPKKGKVLFTRRWKNICHLLRRLELGLLLVSFKQDKAFVEEAIRPQPFDRGKSIKLSSAKRRLILEEFSKRHGDYNVGGSTGKKLITAYREQALKIAAFLESNGSLSIKQLKNMGTDPDKTASILQDNFYGWFERVSRGVYRLTDKGREEIANYRKNGLV
ncbi:MAG TPA: DUF2161 family putative PD-(D/E)XK-type phosphodiesterase [Acetivibrio sp.]|uniref:DUF2161 family putative PD-(D/E)XK-type phosphodiesterase n=1 Tax=Acetivibrio sp. TaxID=1872092 RepID=UPI002BA8689C|nr:DUF2161 family putative PD-(D/E)XK-type phosphodiesterase [Acetivibrio sp.]HOM02568.1 DUF2161 family putative PD-(D/E)XK-type phosphodiesterase [Acetivibrio sp.]